MDVVQIIFVCATHDVQTLVLVSECFRTSVFLSHSLSFSLCFMVKFLCSLIQEIYYVMAPPRVQLHIVLLFWQLGHHSSFAGPKFLTWLVKKNMSLEENETVNGPQCILNHVWLIWMDYSKFSSKGLFLCDAVTICVLLLISFNS